MIDTNSNKMVGKPIEVGPFPLAIAVGLDGKRAYIVHNQEPQPRSGRRGQQGQGTLRHQRRNL